MHYIFFIFMGFFFFQKLKYKAIHFESFLFRWFLKNWTEEKIHIQNLPLNHLHPRFSHWRKTIFNMIAIITLILCFSRLVVHKIGHTGTKSFLGTRLKKQRMRVIGCAHVWKLFSVSVIICEKEDWMKMAKSGKKWIMNLSSVLSFIQICFHKLLSDTNRKSAKLSDENLEFYSHLKNISWNQFMCN